MSHPPQGTGDAPTKASLVFWKLNPWPERDPAVWWAACAIVFAVVAFGSAAAFGKDLGPWPVVFVVYVLFIVPVFAIRSADAFDNVRGSMARFVDPSDVRRKLDPLVTTFFSHKSGSLRAVAIGNAVVTAASGAAIGLPFRHPLLDLGALATMLAIGFCCGAAAWQALGLLKMGYHLPRFRLVVDFGTRCDRLVAQLRQYAIWLTMTVLVGYVLFFLAVHKGPFQGPLPALALAVWGILPLSCVAWGTMVIRSFENEVKLAHLEWIDAQLEASKPEAGSLPDQGQREWHAKLWERRAQVENHAHSPFSMAGFATVVVSGAAAAGQVGPALGPLAAALGVAAEPGAAGWEGLLEALRQFFLQLVGSGPAPPS